MNNILKTGLLFLILVFILKYILKLASNVFGGLIALGILIMLIGIFNEVRSK